MNDRFASYIEQVRNLKELNLNYEYELKVVKEQLGRDTEDIKKLYEAELRDARKLIDETANEKARQQLLANKNGARVKELETEMKELKDEMETMKNRAIASERNAAAMDAQRKAAVTEKSALVKELREKDAEIEELRANIDELRSLLEDETLCKVDLQNNLQSLNEELSFRRKIYEEELKGMHEKVSHSSFYSKIDTSMDPGQLEIIIDELREKSDMDIADFKEMLETAYRNKITKLEDMSSRDTVTINELNMELKKFNATFSDSKIEILKLQKIIEKIECQLDIKDNEISRMTQKHASDIASMREERRALQESYDKQIEEYRVLMDLKVQLDQEIATYRALLQEEENRLNLTPTPRREKRKSRPTSEPAVKKPRFDTPVQKQSTVTSSAAGCIQLCEVDPAGRFVQIKNMSTAAESIGGFKIAHDVSGEKEIAFKFHQKSKLQGGGSVMVWGSEASGSVHNPPHDIIWRNQPSWGAGGNAVTKLVSKSGEVVATFTQRSESSPAKSRDSVDAGSANRSFPHLETQGGGRVVGQEHMFHQQGDPPRQEQNSCVIC